MGILVVRDGVLSFYLGMLEVMVSYCVIVVGVLLLFLRMIGMIRVSVFDFNFVV